MNNTTFNTSPQKNSVLAIISVVFAILPIFYIWILPNFVFFKKFLPSSGLIGLLIMNYLPFSSIMLGFFALHLIKKDKDKLKGRLFAITGITLSIVYFSSLSVFNFGWH